MAEQLDQIREEWDEVPSLLTAPDRRADRVKLVRLMTWAQGYELPPSIGMPLLLLLLVPPIALESIAGKFPRLGPLVHLRTGSRVELLIRNLTARLVGPIAVPLLRNLDSLTLHQQTMHRLVDRVRRDQDDKAFFKALGIDPAAIFARPLRKRYELAVFEKDSKFLVRVGNVLKEPPKPEHLRETARLNTAFLLMSIFGQLERITGPDMAYELFVKRARLYRSIEADPNAKESLWKLVQIAKRRYRKKVRGEKSS